MSLIGRIGIIFARKWIGGITTAEVLAECKRLNCLGESVIVNYLGEDYTDKSLADASTDKYMELIRGIRRLRIKGCIAVKPTQIGLAIDYGMFLSNYARIAGYAGMSGIDVWLDMEDYMFVDSTIKAYLHVLKGHKNVGICIQSKLRRSLNDVQRITKGGGMIRLVKGAYPARKGITYMNKQDVDSNYVRCMGYLFKNSDRFMIATHDDRMIEIARGLEKRYGKRTMFAMLKGIRHKLALHLVSEHERMYIYVPFGEEWIAYSARRLKELEHSMLILRSIISG